MRVSTDPTDPAYIDDRPRKVWLNGAEVAGWIVADEFRRCVITPGVEYQHLEDDLPSRTPDVVHNGGVLIERLPRVAEPRQPRFVRLPDQDANGFDAWHDKATDCVYCAKHGEDPNETQGWFAEGSLVHVTEPVVIAPVQHKHKKHRR